MITLRLSNGQSHSQPFAADSPDTLRQALLRAWQDWRHSRPQQLTRQLAIHILDPDMGQWWAAQLERPLFSTDPFIGDDDYTAMWWKLEKTSRRLNLLANFLEQGPEQSPHAPGSKNIPSYLQLIKK